MTKLSYSEQLKHPNWQRKRLEVLQRAHFSCERCANTELTLHVHHKHYVKGRLAWEYSDAELAALCEECHAEAHEEAALLNAVVAGLPSEGPFSTRDALALLAGYANAGNRIAVDGEQIHAMRPFTFLVGEIAGYMDDVSMDTAMAVADGLVNLSREQRQAAFAEFARHLLSLQDHD